MIGTVAFIRPKLIKASEIKSRAFGYSFCCKRHWLREESEQLISRLKYYRVFGVGYMAAHEEKDLGPWLCYTTFLACFLNNRYTKLLICRGKGVSHKVALVSVSQRRSLCSYISRARILFPSFSWTPSTRKVFCKIDPRWMKAFSSGFSLDFWLAGTLK